MGAEARTLQPGCSDAGCASAAGLLRERSGSRVTAGAHNVSGTVPSTFTMMTPQVLLPEQLHDGLERKTWDYL